MLDGYHLFLRSQARKQVEKPIFFPAPRLGVGSAENMQYLNFEFYYPTAQKAVYIPSTKDIEDVTPKNAGQVFSEEDFPSQLWIGNAIGGF